MSKKDESRPSPFASPSWIASAVFVGGLMVLGVVVSIGIVQKDSSPSEHGSPRAVAACAHVSQNLEASDLQEADWDAIGDVYAPSVAGVGPALVETDGFRRCFARSEPGAVVAAATYVAIGSGRPELSDRLASDATLPGPGRDAAIAQTDASSTGSSAGLQIVAYQVARYTTTDAEIRIAVRSVDGRLVAGSVPLRWADDDWKLVVDPATGRYVELAAIPNLAGMAPWGANQ
ncbi:hypothetical protein [Agromyces aureus]|uniref:DUF8175 domain-containing protein n=1 Tax=Agromyces aureus TaxID=453304 RepID=A0A191WC11_9MICO|nr:hypothetical protein [Agromyces aureus]ANJ25724.1 hypothetical protein ATC03_02040 [Agromyces aureus]